MSNSLLYPDDPGFGPWLTGFTDGEGFFSATWRSDGRLSICFGIHLRIDDLPLLRSIKETLGGIGGISFKRRTGPKRGPSCEFKVSAPSDLKEVIIPHFEAYPLRSKKAHDFDTWREIVNLEMGRREHKEKSSEYADQFIPLIEKLQQYKRYNHYKTFFGISES